MRHMLRGARAMHHIESLKEICWRKSALSSYNGNCVEVAQLRGASVGIRDSKDNNIAGRVLVLAPDDWREFVQRVKRGQFDL